MSNNQKASKLFSKRRIFLVLFICISFSVFLFYREFSKSKFDWQVIHFTNRSFLFISLAIVMMFFRDIAYMFRLRILTDKLLTWRQSVRVILLWEFASAVSPGVVGGSAVAMFILQKEKIPLGKSTALVITTAIMDNFFYLIFLPLLFLFIPLSTLFPPEMKSFETGALLVFWIGFGLIVLLNILLMISIFVYPKFIGNLLRIIFKLPFLKKRKHKAEKFGADVELASQELKGKKIIFWLGLFATTMWSWISRYLVINFVLLAFLEIGLLDNLIILGRQLVMWLVMLVTPTPGGSGMAEYLFGELLSDFIKNGTLAFSLAFLWRLISYYPYLIIGTIILPRWLSRKSA